MTHLVNQLRFEMNCPDEELAFQLRYGFGEMLQDQLSEAIDRVCSKYVNEDEWIQLDKIEIDLGRFSPDSFASEFASLFYYEFEKELVGQLARIPTEGKQISKRISLQVLLRHFLQKGVLPWWANELDINLNGLSHELILDNQESWKQFFYGNRRHSDLWKRISFQFKDEFKALIISLFEDLKRADHFFQLWLAILCKQFYPSVNVDHDRYIPAIQNLVLSKAPLIFNAAGNKEVLANIFLENASQLFSQSTTLSFDISSVPANLEQLLLQQVNTISDSDKSEQQVEINKTIPEIDLPAEQETEEEQIKHLVKEAGIILLSPFLQTFFTRLDLLEANTWKNKDACYRAIHLLKYLGTGDQQPPEFTLLLEKIICGLPPEEPVPIDIEFTENEMTEANALLVSVLEHWKALKNTSVNGLRENFLKRDGLVRRKENDWLLQVERKTLDVLLDSIPWGYSTVRLPWNNYFILVEW